MLNRTEDLNLSAVSVQTVLLSRLFQSTIVLGGRNIIYFCRRLCWWCEQQRSAGVPFCWTTNDVCSLKVIISFWPYLSFVFWGNPHSDRLSFIVVSSAAKLCCDFTSLSPWLCQTSLNRGLSFSSDNLFRSVITVRQILKQAPIFSLNA